MEVVQKHIESFPVVDGHYTRKDSNRKYLGADLNITRMYQLYLEQCKGEIPEKDIVSQSVYRKGSTKNIISPFMFRRKISVVFALVIIKLKMKETSLQC